MGTKNAKGKYAILRGESTKDGKRREPALIKKGWE